MSRQRSAQGEYLCGLLLQSALVEDIGLSGAMRQNFTRFALDLETIRQMPNKEKAERRTDAALVGEKFPPPRRLIARCTCLIARALIARRRHAALSASRVGWVGL